MKKKNYIMPAISIIPIETEHLLGAPSNWRVSDPGSDSPTIDITNNDGLDSDNDGEEVVDIFN